MVGVTGFEPAASTSQTSRATNCATPRCVIFIRFLVIFRKWSNLWSDHFFVLVLEKRMCEKVSIYKGFRAFEKSRSQNRLHAPKARALPISLRERNICPTPRNNLYIITDTSLFVKPSFEKVPPAGKFPRVVVVVKELAVWLTRPSARWPDRP